MSQGGGHFQASGLKIFAQQLEDFVTPHFLEGVVIEVTILGPTGSVLGEPSAGSGEVEMEVSFQVPSETVERHVDAGVESLFLGQGEDDAGGQRGEEIEKVAVHPEEFLEGAGEGEGDVLPGGVGEGIEAGFDPVVGCFFAAGGAKSGLAGMGRLDAFGAFGADVKVVAQVRGSADQHFEDVDDDADPDEAGVHEEQFPPVPPVEEDIPDLDTTHGRDDFHRYGILTAKPLIAKVWPPKAA
jgi:hypothetical protein